MSTTTATTPTPTPASHENSNKSDEPLNLDLKNKIVNTSPSIVLSAGQRTIVSSVLDLFAGQPTKAKLALWADDAEFEDPLTIARGRRQYEAQWYGLLAVFSAIEIQSHEVVNGGNPIEIHLRNRYKIKGLGRTTDIQSTIIIETTEEKKEQIALGAGGLRIVKVQDRWDNKLPDSSIVNVSELSQLISPLWWFQYTEGWAFWTWSLAWETRPWRVSSEPHARIVSSLPYLML